MKRQHWFHCTSTNKGPSFVADLRAPLHMSVKEPATPRLCVAPTISECFAAVLFDARKPVYCYRTETPRRAVAPRDVWDEAVTRERWLIPPVKMILDRVIAIEEASRAQGLIREYHRITRSNSRLWTRVAQFAIAAEVIGTEREKKRARRCCDICKIGDAELFLIGKVLGD